MICPNCGFKGDVRFCPQCGTPMEEMSLMRRDEATSTQGIGAKFGGFWRKNKRNKILIIIAALVLIGIVRSIVGGIGSPDIDTPESFEWPSNDMAQMIPEPEGKLTSVSTSDGDYLMATVECTMKEYEAFVNGCKEMGFDKKQEESQYDESHDYSAENKDAFILSASYYDGELSIDLNSPKEETEKVEETGKPTEPEETTAEKEEASSDEVSADFKETMDEYEKFMDEYVEFMKEYENSDDTASMLADYGKMMTQYSKFAEKIDAIDEDNLSDADYAYYVEVTGRVNEKLLEVQ